MVRRWLRRLVPSELLFAPSAFTADFYFRPSCSLTPKVVKQLHEVIRLHGGLFQFLLDSRIDAETIGNG